MIVGFRSEYRARRFSQAIMCGATGFMFHEETRSRSCLLEMVVAELGGGVTAFTRKVEPITNKFLLYLKREADGKAERV
jgi:hypothetical protein